MPVHHNDQTPDVPHANHALERLATSTRVLLDSPSRPVCVACSARIEQGTQYKCVTVRTATDGVTERLFCDQECLHEEFDTPGTRP